ncbi:MULTISPECIES: hypothetical protein [Phenylobacterium]|uniref:Chromosome partitioning protein ParB n=1 Tax=Phenylobacterium koreense TaxID=266125 RepID=A0ABV2EHA5_9CAUL
MSRDKYTRPLADGRRGLWWTDRLWALAADLPVQRVKLAAIPELEIDCWFGERHRPTVREVAGHAKRILDADPAYPVILCAEGRLMDGGHRLAKALIAGQDEIAAVRFPVTPEPDEILPF